MGERSGKSWRTLRAERPLNGARVATYERLMEAEQRLDAVRRRRGLPETALADILDECEAEPERPPGERELYLAVLARYVGALGGELELRAEFADGEVGLPLTPPA